MASDIDTATPEPGSRPLGRMSFGAKISAALGRVFPGSRRRAPMPATTAESPSLLRRRRSIDRRHSPLTRRILLLNLIPVALLTLGAVYLSDYEEELIDAELASLLVQGEMVAAGIGEVAVVGGETTVNRMDADAARQLLTRLVRPTGVRGAPVQRDRRAAGRFGRVERGRPHPRRAPAAARDPR
jgi:two-component system sensor histidine kinase ChvG